MAVESAQMADLNKMAALKPDPTTGALMWCDCKVSRCADRYCRCVKDSRRCNPKCRCKNCRNQNDVRGSEPEQADDTGNMAREPPQMGSRGGSKRPRTEPSSGIGPEQVDTSNMAVESAQMADLNKMVAPKPAASVSPGKVRRPLPENFKGCNCPTCGCKNGNCPCYAASSPCTSKCECVKCVNTVGDRGLGDSNTEPVTWCRCTVAKCADMRCSCLKVSQRCNSKCVCGDCHNRDGGDPDEAVYRMIAYLYGSSNMSQSRLTLSPAGSRN